MKKVKLICIKEIEIMSRSFKKGEKYIADLEDFSDIIGSRFTYFVYQKEGIGYRFYSEKEKTDRRIRFYVWNYFKDIVKDRKEKLKKLNGIKKKR